MVDDAEDLPETAEDVLPEDDYDPAAVARLHAKLKRERA